MPFLGQEPAQAALVAADIADGAVTTAKLAGDAVTNAKLADDTLDSEHYVDGSIDTAHLAADAITNAKIADDALDSEHYTDASIDTAHIAANAIDGTLTKDALIGDYSDVTITASDLIMYGDATDSNNTKRDTVQGILDLAGGGGWEFVGQSDGAGTALVSFENMTTGYDYLYTITNAVPVSDNQKFNCLFGVAGITYRTADYRGFTGGRHDGGSTDQGEFSSAIHMGANPQGSTSSEKSNYELTIYDPAASGTITSFGGFAFGHSNTGDEIGCYIVGGFHNVTEAIVAVKWSYASGNIESGLFRQYKRANA